MAIKHGIPLMGRTWAEGIKYGGRWGQNGWKREENEENFVMKSFMICTSHLILVGR